MSASKRSTSHSEEVVEYLREKCYVSEASVWPLECVSAHTWYSAEPYEHPHTGTLEERTFHPRGLTDDEAHEIAIAGTQALEPKRPTGRLSGISHPALMRQGDNENPHRTDQRTDH